MKELEKCKNIKRVYKLNKKDSDDVELSVLRKAIESLRTRLRFFSKSNSAKWMITYVDGDSISFVTLMKDQKKEIDDTVNSIKLMGGKEINIFEKKDYYINKCVVCFNELCSCTPRN